jgi:hypothetical protein
VVSQIVTALREDQRQASGNIGAERTRLESQLTGICARIDAAYTDKLDGKIAVDLRERKMGDWLTEEQQVKIAIQGPSNADMSDKAVDVEKIFELAKRPIHCMFHRIRSKRPNRSECYFRTVL